MTPDEELKKKYPNLEKFWPYIEINNSESPRGKVLVSTGFLEEQLKQILLAFMVDTPEAEKLLEGGNAPLGTLSSRISACFVLGLITENEHNDLHLIRKIRNDFAHDMHTTFDTQSVVNRCRELHHAADDSPGQIIPPAGKFHSAAVGLIMILTNRPKYVSNEKRITKAWMY